MREIEKNIHEEAHKSKILADTDQMVCEKVIMVFNTDDEKDKILKEFSEINPSVIGPYFGPGSENIKIK